MTVSSPNVIEIKLDRLIDDVRFLRSQMIAFDRQLKGIEASLKPSEPPESKSRPWFAAAADCSAIACCRKRRARIVRLMFRKFSAAVATR
jgi:hypothetical protein